MINYIPIGWLGVALAVVATQLSWHYDDGSIKYDYSCSANGKWIQQVR